MIIDEVRIYSEVLEQGLNIKKYFDKNFKGIIIKNIYSSKAKKRSSDNKNLVNLIRQYKDLDILITLISNNQEFPITMIEYSTAVPTDDHRMQRADLYFWASIFKVPVLKISPLNKGMNFEKNTKKHGGGSKISSNLEKYISFKNNVLLEVIEWNNSNKNSFLDVEDNFISCIKYNNNIQNILSDYLMIFERSNNYDEWYKNIFEKWANSNNNFVDFNNKNYKEIFSESTRFGWHENKLNIKINRFGHAMDPERGILYFANLLFPVENISCEIQIERKIEKYKPLFGGTSNENELLQYVYSKENVDLDKQDALYIFKRALNINEKIFLSTNKTNSIFLENKELEKILFSNDISITVKTLFSLTTSIKLTDKNRKTILLIEWKSDVIKKYFNSIKKFDCTPLVLNSKWNKISEDIITFSSVEIYKKANFNILAVSYPGAQGDRALLLGSGRNVKRKYIDVMTYKNNPLGISLFLQENKNKFSKSFNDMEKLVKLSEMHKELKNLLTLMGLTDNIEETFLSLGAEISEDISTMPNIDYLMMFKIDNSGEKTKINWQLALLNISTLKYFENLLNKNKFQGIIELEKIYKIDE